MGKLIQYQVYLHLILRWWAIQALSIDSRASIDSTIAIVFGVVGTLLAIFGLFIAYKQLQMMHFASQQSEPPSVSASHGIQLKDSRSAARRRQRNATIPYPP